MSGTQIPLQVQPFSPFTGQKAETDIEATQAGIGQTQAQTGLIGEQARTAQIGNQIASARLPFLLRAYGAAGGTPPPGMPGAIGASGGQDYTGPDGIIPDQNGPLGGMGSLPKGAFIRFMMSPAEKWADLAPKVREEKNAYVNQAASATLDPTTGQADPVKWNQMVANEVQSGYMTASQARILYGHPELAQTILQSTLPVGEQPGTKQTQAAATAAGQATQKIVKVNAPVLDANGQPTGQNQDVYYRQSDLLPNGQPKPGAQTAQYGPPVQATDLPPTAQKFLRALSPSEANAPDQRYVPPGSDRPATFDTTQGHPGQGAAGLFQFEPETWQRGAQLAGVNPNNMSQANQERAAWAVAQDDYAKNSGGRSLLFDINRGNVNQVAAGLKSTWPSITGGAQQNAVGASFTQRLAAITGQPNAATAAAPPLPVGPRAAPVAAASPPQFTPGVEAARAVDTEHIKADDTLNQSNLDAAQKALSAGIGIREARDLIANVPTGAFIDQRLALQSAAQQTGSPLLSRISTALTGLNPQQLNDAEFARKLYQNNVVSQEQAIGGVRIGAMFTNFFAKASPNLSLQNGALNEMSNAALVGQQMIRDFANGSNAYTNAKQQTYQQNLAAGRYQPYPAERNYEATWTADGSPHAADTYAAAVHILNGAPITQAVKGLNPAQLNEAIDVIARADPGAMPKILARPDVRAWRKSLKTAANGG
jgi:muramidase (phage lysozyme)